MKYFFRLLAVLGLLSSAFAADPIDLGQGLTYLRINSLTKSAADLTAALLRPAPLILDLRYPADEPAAAQILSALNSQPAKPTLYVLVSPATPAQVAEVLSTTSTRLVILGVKDSHPAPQVVVEQTAAADRAAYAAFESGTGLAPLISGKIEKERFDEATLVQEFKTGNHDARPPAPGPAEGPEAGQGKAASPSSSPAVKPADRVTDRVLQRAVHLHRALLALKR